MFLKVGLKNCMKVEGLRVMQFLTAVDANVRRFTNRDLALRMMT